MLAASSTKGHVSHNGQAISEAVSMALLTVMDEGETISICNFSPLSL